MTTPMEVAEHLRRKVDTDEWQAAHSKKTIKKISVIYSDHADISERPANGDNAFEPLTGKMTSFSFLMLAAEQIARRERSCWCAKGCMLAHTRDSPHMQLGAEGELHCLECESGQRFGGPAFSWHEQSIKDLGTGLAGRRKNAQAQGAALARKLKPGDFLAVQARERWSTAEEMHVRPGHFWVAQTSGTFKVEVADKRRTSA